MKHTRTDLVLGFGIPILFFISILIFAQWENKYNSITQIEVAPAVENVKIEVNEPISEPPIFRGVQRFREDEILEFDASPTGSCGMLDIDRVICQGEKEGDICMIRIKSRWGILDSNVMYIQKCCNQSVPIAFYDWETNEWIITFDRKVELL